MKIMAYMDTSHICKITPCNGLNNVFRMLFFFFFFTYFFLGLKGVWLISGPRHKKKKKRREIFCCHVQAGFFPNPIYHNDISGCWRIFLQQPKRMEGITSDVSHAVRFWSSSRGSMKLNSSCYFFLTPWSLEDCKWVMSWTLAAFSVFLECAKGSRTASAQRWLVS